MCNCSGFIGQEENEFLGLKTGILDGVKGNTFKFKQNKAMAQSGGQSSTPSGAREVSEEERNADGSPSSNTGLYIGIGVGVIILIVVGIFLYKKFSK